MSRLNPNWDFDLLTRFLLSSAINNNGQPHRIREGAWQPHRPGRPGKYLLFLLPTSHSIPLVYHTNKEYKIQSSFPCHYGYKGLEQVITNMSLLNRNLETIITIGRDFENVASLWRNFQTAIVTNKDNKDRSNEDEMVLGWAGNRARVAREMWID